MTSTEEIAQRGREALFVLENPAYIEAVEKFTKDIRALRLQLSPRDTEGATKLVLMEQAVEKARRLMETYVQDGERARLELEREINPGPVARLSRRIRRG